jgi:hypothetical protein
MVPIRHPEHAIRHRTILHASRRPRAPRAHLVDHRHNMRLAFPLGRRPLGNRLILLDLAIHITRHCRGIFSHRRSIEPPNSPTFSTHRAAKSTPCIEQVLEALFADPNEIEVQFTAFGDIARLEFTQIRESIRRRTGDERNPTLAVLTVHSVAVHSTHSVEPHRQTLYSVAL